MDIEDLKKVENLIGRMRLIRAKAETFCMAESISLQVPAQDSIEGLFASRDGFSEAEKRLYREITEALLQYFKVEYRAVRSQLAELGISMPYNDEIKIAGMQQF